MRRSPFRTVLVGVALTAGLLTGCAPAPTIPGPVSAELQTSVVQVAELAKATDYPTALATLDALEARLAEHSAAGDITAEDAARISESIALVRADLQALAAGTPAPAPAETPPPAPVETEAPSEPVDPEPAPSPEPGTDADGEADAGPDGDQGTSDGNSEGNSNGNSEGNSNGNSEGNSDN